jgi:hypothetical protein
MAAPLIACFLWRSARWRHAGPMAKNGLLEVVGSFLRILTVSDHEDERGRHGRSAS